MTKFFLKIVNSEDYKAQICKLWDDCLPGTPHERYEWLINNPDGPVVWCLAFDEQTKDPIGAISILPRQMIINGEMQRAGIVGDFMVSKAHRVFGPALDLLKMTIASVNQNTFDFVYTLPNSASAKLIERAGYKPATAISYYVRPISAKYYISKLIKNKMAMLLSPLPCLLLRFMSKEAFMFNKGYYEEIECANEQLDKLIEQLNVNNKYIGVSRCSRYINWRYLNNYSNKFKIITYKVDDETQLLGYVVFYIRKNKIEIFDIHSIQDECIDYLLKKIINIARKHHCHAIYIRLSICHPLLKKIRWFGFYNARNDGCLFIYGMNENNNIGWSYIEGDRNI